MNKRLCTQSKKYVAIQHMPGYFEGFVKQITEFNTLDELLEEIWVKTYLTWDERPDLSFVRNKDGTLLLIANKDHTWWWVAAHVTEGSIDELPICEFNS